MTNSSTFDAIREAYQRGELDKNLDSVYEIAAAEGIVLLPGRETVKAKCTSYEIEDLLLPFNRNVYDVSSAFRAGMDVFPTWFSYKADKEYFDFKQADLCREFVAFHALTRHNGKFLSNGEPITDEEIKEKLLRCLSIVRQDAGGKLYGTFSALKTQCKDDAPPAAKTRLSIEALTAEMEERGYKIRLNEITRNFEITGTTGTGRTMQLDDLAISLHDSLSDKYKFASFSVIEQYLTFLGRENSFNPILELLESTAWDGTSRITQLYSLLGIENNDLSKRLVLKWAMQAICLLFNNETDAFGADGVLVLNGDQGIGKTSFFRHLAMRRQWFGEGVVIRDTDKDTSRRAITVWISELGELESTLRSDIESLKAFCTQSVDYYRVPYGRADIVAPRHTSLCATCNNSEFLIDTTGNRRWWTVNLQKKISRDELQSLDALQLWSEVYQFCAKKSYQEKQSCFRLSDDEQTALALRNGRFEKPMKGETEVKDILSRAQTDGLLFREMTVSEFTDHWNVLRKYSAQQIGAVLKKLGREPRRTKAARLYELPVNLKTDQPFKAAAL